MRITSGKFRHRLIKMTGLDTTRETQDKVRMAIFNMIGQYFDGGICLDLFAGSGAMALEGISRGMDKAYLNDINKNALKIAKENALSLGINDCVFSNLDYKDFFKECNIKFDYIFLDPPYKINNTIEMLELSKEILNEKGIIVFEMAKESISNAEIAGLKLIKEHNYGIKKVAVYKRLSNEEQI